MSKELDQRLHEWLFPDGCWHEWGYEDCRKCGRHRDDNDDNHYSLDGNAMLSLMKSLAGKGYEASLMVLPNFDCEGLIVDKKDNRYVAEHPDPEMAVALAADKVREMEAENG